MYSFSSAARVADSLAKSSERAVPSFSELFRDHTSFVRRVLAKLGVPDADLDDVSQEVFLGVHRNLPRFEGRASLHTWIYGICQRRAVDYRRQIKMRTRRESCVPALLEGDEPANQERSLARLEAQRRLAKFLGELDKEKLPVFVLYEIEGVPMDEVARRVRCARPTAYSRLYAARRLLEVRVARLHGQR
jgi:RNA polymerase sigma-70 factor (ECF subfamily)